MTDLPELPSRRSLRQGGAVPPPTPPSAPGSEGEAPGSEAPSPDAARAESPTTALPGVPTTALPADAPDATRVLPSGAGLPPTPWSASEAAAAPPAPLPTVLLPGPGPEPAAAEPAPRGGIAAFVAAHRRAVTITGLALAFVLAGTGAVLAGVATAPRHTATAPDGQALPPRPLPSAIVGPAALATCSVQALATDPRLDHLYASVLDESGRALLDRDAGVAAAPATAVKALTAAAAVTVLGADFRIATTVVEGSRPGSIVLIARGDPTLSALPSGTESVYVGAPRIADLASQVVKAYGSAHPGVAITDVTLDLGYWDAADKWNADWPQSLRTQGELAPVTPLMVDGGRQDPTKQTSPRSADPVADAAAAFIAALQAADPGPAPASTPTPAPTGDGEEDGDDETAPPAPPGEGVVASSVTVSRGSALGTAARLGEVQSQPVSTLVSQMLLSDDDTLAEHLARVASRQSGSDGSSASLASVLPSTLGEVGLPASDLALVDGSGLSSRDAVPASAMAAFLAAVRDGQNGLDVVRTGLSIAGQSGSLTDRFSGDAVEVRGALTGLAGGIGGAQSLVGYLDAADGTRLSLALFAVRDGIPAGEAQAALDGLAAAIHRCGGNLSNN